MVKKAMILGTWVDAPYHPFQEVDQLLTDLLDSDWEIMCTDDLYQLESLREEGFSLLISYLDAFDKPFPDAAAEEIRAFVREGGKLLCLHNGISLQTHDAMFHLIGGKFLRHPPQTMLRFEPVAGSFLADCEGFEFSEEPYQFEMSGEEVTPLLTYTHEGQVCPGGWSRVEGKGKVVFLTPGHSIATFRVPAYQAMITRSLAWLSQE